MRVAYDVKIVSIASLMYFDGMKSFYGSVNIFVLHSDKFKEK